MKKTFAILSAVFFLFTAVFCLSQHPAQAESSVPDVPVITVDGIDFVPVLFTTNHDYIIEQFSFSSLPEDKNYWMVKLQAIGEGAYSKPRKYPGIDMILTSDAGLYQYATNAISSDAVPPSVIVLFRDGEHYDGDHYFLELDGQTYPLENVPDLDHYSPDLFTPAPTATPEPKSDLQVALETRLNQFTDRSHDDLPEIPALEGQVYIAVFDISELLETSDEAAQAGVDFHEIPAARLAPSYEEADTVLLIYRDYWRVGHYSNGGVADRTYTYVAVISGTTEERVCVAVNEPPEKITASPGNGAAGAYEPETALQLIAERLTETP